MRVTHSKILSNRKIARDLSEGELICLRMDSTYVFFLKRNFPSAVTLKKLPDLQNLTESPAHKKNKKYNKLKTNNSFKTKK